MKIVEKENEKKGGIVNLWGSDCHENRGGSWKPWEWIEWIGWERETLVLLCVCVEERDCCERQYQNIGFSPN